MTNAQRDKTRVSAHGEPPLELDEDLAFHKRERVMRRVGTAGLCVFLLAAFAGLFGSGPLSNAEARSRDTSVVAQYERFTRNGASTRLHFTVRPQTSGPIQLTLNSSFLEGVQIEQILPGPIRVATSRDHYVFEFETRGPNGTNGIVIRYRHESLGAMLIIARVAAAELRIRQFVYP
jgi:hypothetical protein